MSNTQITLTAFLVALGFINAWHQARIETDGSVWVDDPGQGIRPLDIRDVQRLRTRV